MLVLWCLTVWYKHFQTGWCKQNKNCGGLSTIRHRKWTNSFYLLLIIQSLSSFDFIEVVIYYSFRNTELWNRFKNIGIMIRTWYSGLAAGLPNLNWNTWIERLWFHLITMYMNLLILYFSFTNHFTVDMHIPMLDIQFSLRLKVICSYFKDFDLKFHACKIMVWLANWKAKSSGLQFYYLLDGKINDWW